MEKIKVGIIGSLSSVAEKHIEAIKNLANDFELAGVCDLNENELRTQAFKYEIPFWTKYKEMLKASGIDLYVVTTPNYLHRKIGEDIAKEKKDALVEKPLALNLAEADDLIKAFEKRKRNLFVMMQMRSHPAFQAIKQTINEGRLGKILGVSLNIFWFRPREYFQHSTWKGLKKLEGGGLLNQGIYYVDILNWLVGPVESVFGKIATLSHKIETEDTAEALLKLKNGKGLATLNFNIFTYPKNLECSIIIFGEQGTIKVGGDSMEKIELWDVKNCPLPPIQELAYSLQTYVYADMVQCLRRGITPEIDGREARKSLEIIEAIYKSAKENKEIKLPL